jgi:predicted nucleic acid-binding protein
MGGAASAGAAPPAPDGGLIVLDTGALIALERRRQRMLDVWRTARAAGVAVLVPGAVISEWWRGRTDVRDAILAGVTVIAIDEAVGRASGEALAATSGARTVDAIVMAVAARQGAVVYTSDVHDLEDLRAFFPGVRVLSV